MNRATLQAFSAGIIFATAILSGYYYINHSKEEAAFTTADAKKMLEAQGYVLSKGTSNTKISSDETNTSIEPNSVTKQTVVTQAPKQEEKPQKEISYVLQVKSNMTASEIAAVLEEEQIIDNANKFKDYMKNKQLTRKVQIGEYPISSDMDYEEIGQLITQAQ